MTLKKSYKIIISVMIASIFISSAIAYYFLIMMHNVTTSLNI